MLIPIGASRPLIRFPYATLSIMGLCALVHLAKGMLFDAADFDVRFGFIPKHPALLTLFTYQFVHADIFHLLGNCFFFAVAGLKLEDALGHFKFVLFYLLGGIAAAAAHDVLDGAAPLPLIGASGAIAAVLGGFTMLHPHVGMRLLFGPWRVAWEPPAWLFLGFWFAREVYDLATSDGNAGVAFAAHVGGFAFGAFLMWGFFGWNRGEELDMRALGETAEVIYDAAADDGGPA